MKRVNRAQGAHAHSAWKHPYGTWLVRTQKAKGRRARAVKDPKDVKSMQGHRQIHEHKDDHGFWSKMAHQLYDQFLSVIIFLNCYPRRCGAWELIGRADMLKQLSKEGLGNVLTRVKHNTAKTYGPLEKVCA